MIRPFQGIMPTTHKHVYVDESAQVIGKVTLGDHSSVWPCAVLRGDVHSIEVGQYTNIQDGSICHVTHDSEYCKGGLGLSIGHEVTVGHQAMLHACTIGDRCLIGMQTIVLDGAVVEDEVMIGAGSLVSPNMRLESGYLYLGRPCKKIRALTQEEIDFFHYSAHHYAKLASKY